MERWLLSRDSEAFKDLMTRHAAMVFGTCRRIAGSAEEAEDLAQECFWKLARARTNPGVALPAWLHTVATRQSLDHIRTAKRRSARERSYMAKCSDREEPRWEDIEWLVDEAIEQLPEALRYPLVTHFLENKTHNELARELGVSRQTVTYRIRKALEVLRRHLSKRGVAVGAVVLTGLFGSHTAEAVPLSLTARLGKMAIAGTGSGAVIPQGVSLGGTILMSIKTKIAIGVLAVMLVVGALLMFTKLGEENGTGGDNEAADARKGAITPSNANSDELSSGIPNDMMVPDEGEKIGAAFISAFMSELESSSGTNFSSDATSPDGRAESKDAATDEGVLISGYVIDSRGLAILGAHVFEVDGGGACTTDSTGAYSLRVAFRGPRPLQITAQAAGYRFATKQVVVRHDGQRIDGADFVLNTGTTLFGRLLSGDRTPISNARVQRRGFASNDQRGFGNGDYESIALTDVNGDFMMGFGEPGVAVLEVSCAQHGTAGFTGVPVGLDEVVELLMPDFAVLSGRILNQDGTAAAGVRVFAMGHFSDTGTATRFEAIVDDQGGYQIDTLSSGLSYRVCAVSGHGQAMSAVYDLGVFEPAQHRIWDYTIAPCIQVSGQVTGEETGKPITNVHIMYAMDGQFAEGPWVANDGSYSLDIFEPGTYLLFPEQDGFDRDLYMAKYGKQQALSSGEYVIDFKLPDTATMSVRVVDAEGSPVANAKVSHLKVTATGTNTLFGTGSTDGDGRYEFAAFTPGVLCWFYVAKDGFIGTATKGVVTEPSVVYPTQTVILFGSGGVEGTLVDQAGVPLANATLEIWADCGETMIRHQRTGEETYVAQGTTGPDGSFAFPVGIPATQAVLTIRCQPDGGERRLSATLPLTEFVAGHFVSFGRIVLETNTGPPT